MTCIVVTRNGTGAVYSFPDKKAARLHPVTQLYDVFAADSGELAAQFGRDEHELLLRFAEGRDRSALVNYIEEWRSRSSRSELPFDARNLVWRTYCRVAQSPPIAADDIVRVITEDRRAVESLRLRSRSESASPGEFSPQKENRRIRMSEEAKTRSRVSDTAVIKVLVDTNPKRGKSAERFNAYKDGMTVKEAKDAGVTAADITYDKNKGFISVTEPEAA